MLDQKPILAKIVQTIPIQAVFKSSKKYINITDSPPNQQKNFINFNLFPV